MGRRVVASERAAQVVVIGAGGFIGRHVVHGLTGAGIEVRAITRRALVGCEAIPLLTNCIAGDGLYQTCVPREGEFILIDCAWCVPDRGVYAPHAQQLANFAALLDATRGRIRRIIAFGSAEEYGTQEGKLSESMASTVAVSSYSWGKQAMYNLLRQFSNEEGTEVAWLRPFTVYGEGQAGAMAIPYALRQAKAKSKAAFTAGTQERDFVHVQDVAAAVVKAASVPMNGFWIFNLGTGVSTQVRSVIARIAQHFGAEHLFDFGSIKPRRFEPGVQYADTRLAREHLDWSARIDIWSGIDGLCKNEF